MDSSTMSAMAQNPSFQRGAFVFAFTLVLFAWSGHLAGLVE